MAKEEQLKKIRELDAEIHQLFHRIEDEQLKAYVKSEEPDISKIKDETYDKMEDFIYAVRKYDEETRELDLPSNRLN